LIRKHALTTSKLITRTVPSFTSGQVYFSVRRDTSSIGYFCVYLRNSTDGHIAFICFKPDANISLYESAAQTEQVFGTYTSNMWYRIGIDYSATLDQYRVNINNGAWSPYYAAVGLTSEINQLRLYADSNANSYLDFISPSYSASAPVISSVSSSNIAPNSATITWTTDEPSTSQVEYGPTTSYGTLTTLDSNLVYSHNVNLTGLNTDTLYHYRVKSKDAANNEAISADYTFHTAVAPLSLRLPFRDGESWYVTQGNGQGASHQGNEYYAWDFNSVDDWGKPVLAPASGKVVDASAICLTENDLNDTCNSGWGNYVIIDYGNGKFGKLAHLRLVSVKKGQYVFQGEQVGTVGSTGKSSGPHIHYQTQNSSALGGQSIASSFVDVSSNGGVPIGCDCPNDVGTNRYTSGNTAPALIYHLDTALDSSNNGNNGTISTCLIAGCMGLNGTSSDYIEILNSSSLQLAGDVSIVFWLKPENAGSGRINFLDKSYFGEFSLILETDGSLSYYHGQSTSSFFSWVALGAGTIANGQGIRIAVTRNSAEAYMRTYVNGALVSITPYGGNIPSASTSPLKIGLGATGIPYKGKADEIAIYPRVLTDNEVNNEYYSSKP